MANIGPNNPNLRSVRTNPNLEAQRALQNQNRTVESDVSKAKTTNVTTLGRQTNQTAEDKKTTETPKEKVTLTAPRAEIEAPKSETQTKETPSTQAEAVGEEAPRAEKSADDYKMDFLNSFTGNLSQDDAKGIWEKASGSLTELAASGNGEVQHEKVLAAHTYNYAKNLISEKMPNASQKEIREAAKTDPEIAKAVKLLDASSAYVKAAQKEETAAPVSAGGSDAPVEGASAAGGAGASAGASGAPEAGVDPFAAHRASGDSADQGAQQPPENGQPQNPYHLSPEKQAQMMAENHQTMENISKIYAQMFADMQKAAAERFKIMQETAISINEIMMSLHARRAQSQAKHFQMYLQLLTDNWG